MIDLNKTQLAEVRRILRAHLPDRRVVAVESRVQGTARRYSDLDLILIGDEPVDPEALGDLRQAIAEFDLSIQVGLLDWPRLSPSFRQVIDRLPVEIVQ